MNLQKQDISQTDVYTVNIFSDVCKKASEELKFDLNYVYGREVDITANLKRKDESTTQKDTKYPLVALYLPVREQSFTNGYYPVSIKKIIIASLTDKDAFPEDRQKNVVETILKPVYNSVIKYLIRHINTVSISRNNFKHQFFVYFQNAPVSGSNDFVDTLQINNLEFKIILLKNC